MIVHDSRDVLLVYDLLAINGNDEIAADQDRDVANVRALAATAESSTLRRAAGRDLNYQYARIRR